MTSSNRAGSPRARRGPDEDAGSARFEMTFPIIEAKLHPPTLRPGTVDRSRIVERLLQEPGPAVVSLIAPPGYGKTTVLAQWATRERRRVVWLTLDEMDNDPVVLMSYLAVAADRFEPIDLAMRSAITAPRERILATAVPRLASALDGWGEPAVLIFDDIHRLSDRTALDTLTMLFDHLPPGFRVAIAGRREPDLPFARLRAQGRLFEVGQDLLTLDQAEARALTTAVGYDLGPSEVHALTERTEGWAAGIYLAALAKASDGGPPASLKGVSGRDRYIASYFRSEFEGDVDDVDLTLLTRTSILESIAPQVAEAVAGISGAGRRLKALAQRNLLIQELAGPSVAYRCHNLLRDFLRAELERREPQMLPELHARAMGAYVASGSVDLAVSHAQASGDVDAAARLVTAVAVPTFYAGHISTLDRWLQAFDDPAFRRHPPLAVIAGWIHLLSGRSAAADHMADLTDRASHAGPPGDGSTSFESQRAMFRAAIGRRGPQDVLASAQLAASQEGPASPWRANACWLLASGHLLVGDVDAAEASLQDAVAAGATASATAMVSLAGLAAIAMARGDWDAAEAYSIRSLAQLDEAHLDEVVASLLVYAVGARVAIHRGDLAAGRHHLVNAQLVRPFASEAAPWFSVGSLLELARAYLAIGDHAAAHLVVREAEDIVRRRPALGTLNGDLLAMRARLATVGSTLAGASSLSTAELRLLPLLTTYLSFQEIGERLGISRNTVKTEAMSIYGKLQATSRGEAVERAIESGLLEPFPGLRLAPRSIRDGRP